MIGEILFEPSVLKWARVKRFGSKIEVVSEKIPASSNLTVEEIIDWENGISTPSFSQVKTLSEIYKRPLAVFFLDSTPDEDPLPLDFRTIGSTDNREISPAALLMIRKARHTQESASRLYSEIGEQYDFKYPKYRVSNSSIELADKIRLDFEITKEKRKKFKKFEDYFEFLRKKIEEAGVLTIKSGLHDSFPLEDCRAFSLTDKTPYLILINNKDTEGGKNFSLMHEFAHVLLRKSAVCNDFSTTHSHNTTNPVEIFCNQFAGSFLVPSADLKDVLTEKSFDDFDESISYLSITFKVSRFVILRRLQDLGYVDTKIYKEKTLEWENEVLPKTKKKEGGRFSLNTVLKKNGKKYSSLVIEAYKKQKITRSSVSGYLGIKSKHLSNFEKLIT